MKVGVTSVRIVRGERIFHVHGERAGAEGVWLAEGQVQGIYDAPVKTTWKTGAFQVGSRYKGKHRDHRDLILGFHVIDTVNSYEFNESAFRQMFQYELDPWDADRTPTLIEVETDLSGVRRLEVLMYEEPEFAAATDPLKQQYGNLILKLRAGQPDWFEDDFTDEFSSDAIQAAGTITVSNPTDQIAYQRIYLTRAKWTIPDPSWEGAPGARMPGGEHPDRELVDIDITDVSGVARIDWDRSRLMFRDANDTNLQARLGSRFVVYPIPPQTPPTPLPISYTSAPDGGATAIVEVPQRWSRPWGMELQSTVSYLPPLGKVRFTQVGKWSYEIPADATHIDVVMLGGGGGGSSSGIISEAGGRAGKWRAMTLVRGEDIPWDSTLLHGEVGGGGKGGQTGWQVNIGDWGTASLVWLPGQTDAITAPPGEGSWNLKPAGAGVEKLVFNGEIYTGGGDQRFLSSAGRIPGGGGSGGMSFHAGGPGARGQVWIKAYRAPEGFVADPPVLPEPVDTPVDGTDPDPATPIVTEPGWTEVGVVGESTTTEMPVWHRNVIYDVGDLVWHKGFVYRAQQWTRGDDPADNHSGNDRIWQKLPSRNPKPGDDTMSDPIEDVTAEVDGEPAEGVTISLSADEICCGKGTIVDGVWQCCGELPPDA